MLCSYNELFFYHEFINSNSFSRDKKDLIREYMGCFYIENDFTIYQEKSYPIDEINEIDFQNNYFTFIVMLFNLPISQVRKFIQFHYNNYSNDKRSFLDFLYYELKSSKLTQGNKELPESQQKIIAIDWCLEKMAFNKSNEGNRNVYNEKFFLSGENFDALIKVDNIISFARKEIILVDGYIDVKILEVIASKNKDVKCRILTSKKSLSSTLIKFVETFNKQYGNLKVNHTRVFHDRFLIIDKESFYHFGTSLKDAGNKSFMFSEIEDNHIKDKLLSQIENEWSKSS